MGARWESRGLSTESRFQVALGTSILLSPSRGQQTAARCRLVWRWAIVDLKEGETVDWKMRSWIRRGRDDQRKQQVEKGACVPWPDLDSNLSSYTHGSLRPRASNLYPMEHQFALLWKWQATKKHSIKLWPGLRKSMCMKHPTLAWLSWGMNGQDKLGHKRQSRTSQTRLCIRISWRACTSSRISFWFNKSPMVPENLHF